MRAWTLGLLLGLSVLGADAYAEQRLVSLNRCHDVWLAQWLPERFTLLTSDVHGGRLERIISLKPDYVLHNQFARKSLIEGLKRHHIATVMLPQPNSWQQWQSDLIELGKALAVETELRQWQVQQQQSLLQASKQLPQQLMILMPNQYTWASDSWVASLLRQFERELLTPIGSGQIGQLSLETILNMDPNLLILEGFSQDYARANDWRWHSLVRTWIEQRKVHLVTGPIASCPATQAVKYIRAMGAAS